MQAPTSQPRLQLIGTLFMAIAYGFVACIFLHTISLLISNKKRMFTRTTRIVLILYILIMFGLSTASAIQGFVYITGPGLTTTTAKSSGIIEMNEPLFLPLTIFGADFFIVWRVVVLHLNSSLRRRLFLYSALFCISMGTIASGILYYLAPKIPAFATKSPLKPGIITISITTCLNFILTFMIVIRLISQQGIMKRVLGNQFRSPYSRIIVMLVESCCLIVVTGVVFLVFVARGDMTKYNGCIIPLLLLPQVCVAAPLLIVYRVSQRALSDQFSDENGHS